MAIALDQVALGERLRAEREQRRLTLDQVAALSGLSKPFLSRLESGERQPSVAALLELSRALGVRVGALLGEEADREPLRIYAAEESRREVGGLAIATCSGYANSRALEALRVTVHPDRPASTPARHRGEEWLYVLAGVLHLEYAGELHEIPAGSAVHFAADRPHRLTTDAAAAEVLLVWTTEADPQNFHA